MTRYRKISVLIFAVMLLICCMWYKADAIELRIVYRTVPENTLLAHLLVHNLQGMTKILMAQFIIRDEEDVSSFALEAIIYTGPDDCTDAVCK